MLACWRARMRLAPPGGVRCRKRTGRSPSEGQSMSALSYRTPPAPWITRAIRTTTRRYEARSLMVAAAGDVTNGPQQDLQVAP